MRWLLLPLLLLAWLAPSEGCPRQILLQIEGLPTPPPAPMGTPGYWLGTDVDGRDTACLLARGLRRSLQTGVQVLLLALPLGLVLGLIMGWRGWIFALYGEIFVLVGLMMLAGPGGFRWVLGLGVALYLGRTLAVRVRSLLAEPFMEGARALGGSTLHLLRRHLLPHLWPLLPGVASSALALIFLWMAELAVLGYFDQGGYFIDFGSGFETVPMKRFLPLNPDLGQLVASARFEWLGFGEQLMFPALGLVLLTLTLSDLGRKFLAPGRVD